MKATLPKADIQADSSGRSAAVTDKTAEKPLRSLVRAICQDARRDTLTYLLRSDTGHDGE